MLDSWTETIFFEELMDQHVVKLHRMVEKYNSFRITYKLDRRWSKFSPKSQT